MCKVLIGCGKRKRKGRHRVEDLYQGPYFRLCLAAARTMALDGDIGVLSAKHGLLKLNDVVESYDRKITDLSPDEKKAWRTKVIERLGDSWPKLLCGKSYADGLPGEKIMPSVGIGKQMQFLRWLLKRKGLGVCTK